MQWITMKKQSVKLLDNGLHANVDLKKSKINNVESYFTDFTGSTMPLRRVLNFSRHHLCERRNISIRRRKCSNLSINLEKYLQRCYLNFKSSGHLQRLMYSQNGIWTDLSQEVVELINKQMKIKNTMMEVTIDGDSFLMDFMHMIRMPLDTSLQQPIAWVDESNTCYFSECFVVGDDNFDGFNHYEYESDNYHPMSEYRNSNNLKLKFEMEISGADDMFNLKESYGESNDVHVRVSNIPVAIRSDVEDDASSVQDNFHVVEGFQESKRMIEDVSNQIVPTGEHLDVDFMNEMLCGGIGLFVGRERIPFHSGSGSRPSPKGLLKENTINVSMITNYSQFCQDEEHLNSLLGDLGAYCHHFSTEEIQGKSPSFLPSGPVKLTESHWLHVVSLLGVISRKVSAKHMQLVNFHFRLYQNKLISREDFIMRLRLIIGDALLKSTPTNQHKIPSQNQMGLMPMEPAQ